MKVRVEDFGAIVAIDQPAMLLHVDKAFARALGVADEARWSQPLGHLSAPTEVHVLLTGRCHAGCPRCYVDATPDGAERPVTEVKRWLTRLAKLGVFHVALGGGESLLRDDLFEIAEHARRVGLVPNLTTSGIGMSDEVARRCRVFGQVNVSLDGLGASYASSRGYDGSARALKALEQLVGAGVPAGVNYVLSRSTIDSVEETLAAVGARQGNEVEFLRLKPTGRAAATYLAERLTEGEGRSLLPRLLAASAAVPGVKLKVDCSLVPMLCATDPSPAALRALGVTGCEAGNVLAAVAPEAIGSVDTLVDGWRSSAALGRWRSWTRGAPEPCASCAYRDTCRGGCKAVSRFFYDGDPWHPDPECPRVLAHRRGEPFEPTRVVTP
jgi:radical SAM protein with 4Fe4S-binding SPASM domain